MLAAPFAEPCHRRDGRFGRTHPLCEDAPLYEIVRTPAPANAADHEEHGYDAAGNRTGLRKRDGSVLAFRHDGLNRLVARIVADGFPAADLAIGLACRRPHRPPDPGVRFGSFEV